MTLYNGCNEGDFLIYNNGLCVANDGNMTVSYLITRCLMSLNYDDGQDYDIFFIVQIEFDIIKSIYVTFDVINKIQAIND